MSEIVRPKSVTVVAWIIIAFGVFGLNGSLSSYSMLQNGEYDRVMNSNPRLAAMLKDAPRPTVTTIVATAALIVAKIVAAVLMLQGLGLGRWLYVAMAAAGFVAAVAMKTPILFMLPSLLVEAVLLVFLFRPSANEYFALQAEERSASG